MYTFQTGSELMKNQKQAQVLSNSSQLDALQTSDGLALFFSIGSHNILYLYPEVSAAGTGWNPIDLTTELGTLLSVSSGSTVSAKSFSVSQDTNGNITIAQVVNTTDSSNDQLFVLYSQPNDPASLWLQSSANRSWLALPFDGPTGDANDIASIQISPYQNMENAPYLVAGVVGAHSYISNYVVQLDPPPTSTSPAWQSWSTPTNFDQQLGIQFGMPTWADGSPGLYELYEMTGQTGQGLLFTPTSQYADTEGDSTQLSAPAGASAIATLPADSDGSTDLYLAAGDGTTTGAINIFPAAQIASIQIIQSPLIDGVSFFEVHTTETLVTLWGTNKQGTLFYASCPAGQTSNPDSWSTLVPIQQNAGSVASLLNLQTQASELFVNTLSQNLIFNEPDASVPPPPQSCFIKLTRDPTTTQWGSQTLLLPSLNMNDVVEFYTYTTHIDVVDENSLPLPNQAFTLTSTSPVSVYINDIYTTLSSDPNSPTQVESSETGSVTIVQETQSLGAVAYNLVEGDQKTIVNINPMSGVLGQLANVKSASDFPPSLTDETGNPTQLFPSSVTTPQQSAVAQAISQFYQVSQLLPADGTTGSAPSSPPADFMFGLSFTNGVLPVAAGGSFEGAIDGFAGDILHWAHQVRDDVDQFVVSVVKGVAHFFITLGDDLYHFVMTCMSDVLHGIHFVFAKVGVAFENLVQWLGYIFDWKDILATHGVMKSVISNYLNYGLTQLITLEGEVEKLATDLETKIGDYSGLTATASSASSVAGPQPSTSHPAANWGNHQLRSNVGTAQTTYAAPTPPFSSSTDDEGTTLLDLLQALSQSVQTETVVIQTAVDKLQANVLDDLSTLSVEQLIENLLGIIDQALAGSASNVLKAALKVLQQIASLVIQAFDATISIPVLSWMYHRYTSDDLSFLDLACLLAAIPSTVIYKVVAGTAPYPAADANTQAIIHASDFQTVQALIVPPPSPAPAVTTQLDSAPLEHDPSPAQIWGFCANLSAGLSAVPIYIFSAMKMSAAAAGSQPSSLAGIGYAVCYVPYCLPDFGIETDQTWYATLNEVVTYSSIIKNGFDIYLCTPNFIAGTETVPSPYALWQIVSPWVDVSLSVAWCVPAIAEVVVDHSPGGVVSFVGNISFNLTAFFSLVNTLSAGKDDTQITPAISAAGALDSIILYGAAMTTDAFVVGFSKNSWP